MLRMLTSNRSHIALFALAWTALIALSACGDDDTGSRDAGTGTDSGAAADAGTTADPSPMITSVAWEPEAGCTSGSASDFTITVTVTDGDHTPAELTYAGSVTNCTGAIDSATSVINCPNFAPYPGTVTVTDPDDNSDRATFMFGACETGSVDF